MFHPLSILPGVPVVPLAGTWIETLVSDFVIYGKEVVPLAGTWIETPISGVNR